MDESSTRTFVIENEGTGTLYIYTIFLQNCDPGFTLDLSWTSCILSSSAETSFSVTFEPKSDDRKYACLVIENSDQDETPYSVRLTGYGD